LRYSSVLRSSNVSWRQLSYNRLTPKPNDADPDALKPKKLKLSLRDIMALLLPYSGVRVFEQMKAVVPLSLYLVQVLCKPGSVTPHTEFEAEAYILTKEEGGRHTPFFANYRPQFYFRTTDVTGTVKLPAGTEMVMPGDNLKFEVELIAPIAMEEKLRFAIREGGRTVGSGVVSKIIK
jgi:hypothetical protein